MFHISVEDGIELRGQITHYDSEEELSQSSWYYSYPLDIERSLYIGNVLNTVSDAKIVMNDLDSLNYINSVELN